MHSFHILVYVKYKYAINSGSMTCQHVIVIIYMLAYAGF